MICIIPARGGSKRIPRKNVIDFCGKALIAHSIENALNSKIFSEIIVSTDDEEIASVARKFGAKTPFLRPKFLSDDFTSSNEVIKHAIKECENLGFKFDRVCCLYATAPLISEVILRDAFAKFDKTECKFLFSACEFEAAIQRAFGLDDLGRVKMFDESKYFSRSQDLPRAYYDAGAFYFGEKDAWLNEKMLFAPYSVAFLLPKNLVCDIDTPKDLEWAKILFDLGKKGRENAEI